MLAGTLAVSLAGLVTGCSAVTGSKASDEITVVGKNFTEQDIMANLVGLMLEKNTDLKVKTKSYLGGTDVCFSAMKSGSADVYVEYTGTGLVNIMGEKVMSDSDAVYQKVKNEFPDKYKIEWLNPIGFNNTYAIAVTQETAKQYNLKTVSDLKAHQGEIVFGTEQEFLDRDDGLKGMKSTYGLNFKDVKAMDPGLKYQALTSGKVQAIDAFTTDGQLAKNNLVLLADDQHFFPPYYAAPIVRSEVLKQHPEVGDVLNKLAGKIDEKQMAELNAEVDIEKKKAGDVAEHWLEEQGLVKK
ncbi:glycine/betaine ABC transporter substrate-binding protein [Tumebacillus sp. ITR2]|uniref:Glycine/betaine ABC transporter substrate-binding protein n=1 Tax=Tumebacillus amylolyticus TaxID=2801339 RepID=A0ABS1J5U5_9BACL|nr:glycine/betaine ABC transporter substrate-binding protein [Tumebacillus amylolyticus]